MTLQQWLQLLKRLPLIVHLELFGTLNFCMAFFMVWPFLTVILNRDYGISATQIGVYIASSSTVAQLLVCMSVIYPINLGVFRLL